MRQALEIMVAISWESVVLILLPFLALPCLLHAVLKLFFTFFVTFRQQWRRTQ